MSVYDRKIAGLMGQWQREGGNIEEVIFSQFPCNEWPRVTLVLLAIANHVSKAEEAMLRRSILYMATNPPAGQFPRFYLDRVN